MGLLHAALLFAMIAVMLQISDAKAATSSAATVGLYAPDRYEGIPEMCLMPMDFGYCRAKVKRYYFDMRRMKCTMFYWGGCAGNINNFKSLEDCNKICLDAFEASNGSDNRNEPAPSYKSYAGRSGTRGVAAVVEPAAKTDTTSTATNTHKNSITKNNNYNIQNRNSEDVGNYDDDDGEA